jgi:type I restriction enzyme S subunit
VKEIFANASSFIEKPATLSTLVAEIDKLDWYSARQEGLGDLYEGLLEKNANEKKSGAGQYFTPRPLIDSMVAVMQPMLDNIIQDPAAGTGGFLIATNRWLREHSDPDRWTEAQQRKYRRNTFYGMEHVQDAHRLAPMNLMLHGLDSDPEAAGIRCEGGEPGRCAVWRNGTNSLVYQKALHRFRTSGAIIPELLMYRLRHDADSGALQDAFTGTTIKHLTRESLSQYEIPLPPINEQKRIAAKLDVVRARVDACRERLDRVPAILKRFRHSVLAAATSGKLTEEWRATQGVGLDTHTFEFADADAFRDYEFPQSWGRARLSDIASVVGGVTKDAKKQLSEYVEVPYLRVANVQRGFFDLTEIKTIRVPQERLVELLLEPGDILFNEGGDIDKLGRGWVWGSEIEPCVFQNHVFRARLNDRRFSPRFFSWYGNSRGYDYFLSRGKQTTNLASINKSVLSALPIPLPPAEEQDEIVRRVEALFAYADRLEARYTTAHDQIDRLTPALLAKAFRGALVPQDPNDEPASVLLERIRAARAATEGAAGPKRRKGGGRPKTPQKTEVLMLTRNDIQDTHLTMILKEHGPLTAEALWSASQLDIDDFYDQLKDEEARGLLQEKRGDSSNAPRMLEAA